MLCQSPRSRRARATVQGLGPASMFAIGEATEQVVLDDLEAPTDLMPAELAAQFVADESTIRLHSADLHLLVPPPIPRARLAPRGPLPAAPRRLASGTIDGDTPVVTSLGGYTVTGILATGSMGVVYRGIHPTLRVAVAIKTLRPRLKKNSAVVARFFAEAIATARIAHPHVVRYFDFGYDAGGAAFLVTELLEGETLSARLAREGRLDVATAAEISLQVGLALAAAHQLGVVHRDLKPDNIFLCREPARPGAVQVKLLDFGVAKVDGCHDSPMHTQQGDLIGTPCYMAPEQGLSAASSDARSDLYSVGCILFEMVCGRVPFNGNLVETLIAHQASARPAARDHAPQLPAELAELIDRLIARDPANRPQSVAELVSALTALRSTAPSGPVSSSLSRAATVLVRRRTRHLSYAALLVIALGLAVGALVLSRGESAGAGAASHAVEPAR